MRMRRTLVVLTLSAAAVAASAQDFYPVISPFGRLEAGIGVETKDDYYALLPNRELQSYLEASYILDEITWYGVGLSVTNLDDQASQTNAKPFSTLRLEAGVDQNLLGDIRHRRWELAATATLSGRYSWPENIASISIPGVFQSSSSTLLDYSSTAAADAYVSGFGELGLRLLAYDRDVFPNVRISARSTVGLAAGTETQRAFSWLYPTVLLETAGHVSPVPDFLQLHLRLAARGTFTPALGTTPLFAYHKPAGTLASTADRRDRTALEGEVSIESRFLNIRWTVPTGISLAVGAFYEAYLHGSSLTDLDGSRLHQGFGTSVKLRLEHYGFMIESGAAFQAPPSAGGASGSVIGPSLFFIFGEAY